jgi:acyl-CoA synthetase (AMP-forming)/AMP-acid ligase II
MGDYTESAANRGNRGPQVIRSSQSVDYGLQPAMVEGAAIPEQVLAQTLPDLLQAAGSDPTPGVLSVQFDGSEQFYSYAELLDRAQRILRGLRQLGLQPHDPVILQLPQPLEFLAGFWGCVLGGFVPVPLAVAPSYTLDNGKAHTVHAGVQLLEQVTVLTTSALQGAIAEFLQADRPEADQPQIVAIDSLLQNVPDRDVYRAALDDLALILLTSGSTGAPKGVMLSTRNILTSTYGMATVNGLSRQSILLNWMPLEHVASLVMFHLTPVCLGCQQIHAPIDRILQEPLYWLDLLDRYRVTATWAPNFAYGLVIDRAAAMAQCQWDLSSIEWMGNGAEAVVGKTTRQFLTLLEPHGLRSTAVSPGYGMSETCSGIIHSRSRCFCRSGHADSRRRHSHC